MYYTKKPILEVINLEKIISSVGFGKKSVSAVNDVSFKLYEGETLGIGWRKWLKSTLGNAILLLDKATAGQVLYRSRHHPVE
jgi:peptide/nickel transport system ATP-binding protein